MTLSYWLNSQGCTCHIGHPPCSFCLELDEEEADIYSNGGMKALGDYIEKREEEAVTPVHGTWRDRPSLL